ncbi:MAG: hypothetical protein ACLRR3_07400 [Eubacterium sp.]
MPENTTFKKIGSYIRVTFPGKNGYMSIGSMLNKSQIEKFYRHGYAFVTDTKVTYSYDDSTSEGNFKHYINDCNNKSLREMDLQIRHLLCMLPHQWKNFNR